MICIANYLKLMQHNTNDRDANYLKLIQHNTNDMDCQLFEINTTWYKWYGLATIWN